MPLSPEEEQLVRQILTGMCLNKHQVDKFLQTLSLMLNVCPIRIGQNVMTQEKGADQPKVAMWTINMPIFSAPVPPDGGTTSVVPFNQTLRRAA